MHNAQGLERLKCSGNGEKRQIYLSPLPPSWQESTRVNILVSPCTPSLFVEELTNSGGGVWLKSFHASFLWAGGYQLTTSTPKGSTDCSHTFLRYSQPIGAFNATTWFRLESDHISLHWPTVLGATLDEEWGKPVPQLGRQRGTMRSGVEADWSGVSGAKSVADWSALREQGTDRTNFIPKSFVTLKSVQMSVRPRKH